MSAVQEAPVVGTAPLVDLDPELADGLNPGAHAALRRHAIVHVMRLPPGCWTTDALCAGAREPFAALVSEGLVVSEVVIGDAVAAELLGPGDLVGLGTDSSLLPAGRRWSVAQPVTVGILDAHVVPVLRAWPALGAVLTERAARFGERLEVQRAISQLPRVEDRLLAVFGHLGERFGRIGPAGVIVPLALTHQMLGRLVGARRPTVSLALKALAARDALVRRGDGAWLVANEAFAHLAPAADAPPARPGDAVAVALPPEPVAQRREVTVSDLHRLTSRCENLMRVSAAIRERSQATVERAMATRDRVQAGRASRDEPLGLAVDDS